MEFHTTASFMSFQCHHGNFSILPGENIHYHRSRLICAHICGSIQSGRVEPVSPRHGDIPWAGSTPKIPVPASLCSSSWTLSVSERPTIWVQLRDGDARDGSLIDRGGVTTSSFVGLSAGDNVLNLLPSAGVPTAWHPNWLQPGGRQYPIHRHRTGSNAIHDGGPGLTQGI